MAPPTVLMPGSVRRTFLRASQQSKAWGIVHHVHPIGSPMGAIPSRASFAAAAAHRYAGEGVAVDCLSKGVKMDGSTPVAFPVVEGADPGHVRAFLEVRTGSVTCPTPGEGLTDGGDITGWLLFTILLTLHVGLLTLPLQRIGSIYDQVRAQPAAPASGAVQLPDERVLRRPGSAFAGLGMFSVASLGEISQHVHDNWLFLGLLPSYYNLAFYGGLALGQTLLAQSLVPRSDKSTGVSISWAVTALSISLMAWGTAATAEAPPSLGTWLVIWIPTFLGLGWTTGVFGWQAFHAPTSLGSGTQWRYAGLVAASYIAGIFFSIQLSNSGQQWWHVPTAASFVSGFLVQAAWLQNLIAHPLPPPPPPTPPGFGRP